MTSWFIREDIAQAMIRDLKAGTAPTSEQCAQSDAQHVAALPGETPNNMRVAGDTAEILVEGALTMRPSYFARYYGGGNTTYQDIITGLALAQADASIRRVVLHVNSPGGNVAGLFETLAAIESFTKPIESKVTMACSAAYAIAALTQRVEATMPAACLGSIGVASTYIVWSDEVTITSTEAPNKRPDVRTEDGKAVIRKELDDLHDLFVAEIAKGRRTTAANVNATFGRGAVVLAAEALTLKMIDGVAGKSALRSVTSVSAEQPTQTTASAESGAEQETPMDLKTLKAQHPDCYESVLTKGAEDALKVERDRVNAHLTAGEMSGDMKTALASIRSGEAMTQTLQTQYMMAAANRSDRVTRQEETDAAASAAAGAVAPEEEGAGDLGDAIVALRKKQKEGF